jgi:hypothetical protein
MVVRFSRSGFEGDDDGWKQRAGTDPIEVPPRVEGKAIHAWSERRPVGHQTVLPSFAVSVATADDAPRVVAGAALEDDSHPSRRAAARGIEYMRRNGAHVPRILYEPPAGKPCALAPVEDHLPSQNRLHDPAANGHSGIRRNRVAMIEVRRIDR